MVGEGFTFVTAVNDEEVFQKNLCLSPAVSEGINQLIVKRNCDSMSLAYNEAINETKNEIIIFVHQDVFLPKGWTADLKKSLEYLAEKRIDWGVLGCYGVRAIDGKPEGFGRVYSTGLGVIGTKVDAPEPVDTLDEIVLIKRKSSGLTFDPSLPHFHLYGADICMKARERGLPSYVIPAFCVHNTSQIINLPKEFYECYRHIKRRWKKYLPIYTPCIKISAFDGGIYSRRFRNIYGRLFHKPRPPANRAANPEDILEQLTAGR